MFDRIIQDPKVMNGQAVIKGTRTTVARVLHAMASYPDRTELLKNYLELDEEAIRQALEYAGTAVSGHLDLAETI